jgi:hypothetical protein
MAADVVEQFSKKAPFDALTEADGFVIFKWSRKYASGHSSVAQWQSIRLLTEGL